MYSIQPLLTIWGIEISEAEVLHRWQEPHRKYHTLAHLYDLFNQIEKLSDTTNTVSPIQKEMLKLTAIFHDIIYEPRKSGNEEQSAKLFLYISQKSLYQERIQEIADMIRDTKTHQPRTPLSKTFSEMDMSIVQKPFAELQIWEEGIRYEYQHVPKLLYAIGRGRFLRQAIRNYPENADNLRQLLHIITPWYLRCLLCLKNIK